MAVWSRIGMGLAVGLFAVAVTFAVKFVEIDNSSTTINFVSQAHFHEGADWDAENNRILLARFTGGIAQVSLSNDDPNAVLRAENVVMVPKKAGNPCWNGIRVDSPRNRVLVALTDWSRNYSALTAYDSRSWKMLFLKELAGPESLSFADDIAVDEDGNAYVTDAAGSLIWKVSPDGSRSFVLTSSPLFKVPSPLPFQQASLNGIVYHPDGYLLVGHTWGGAVFKVSLDGTSVYRVNVTGSLLMADGFALLSPEKLVIACALGTKLVVSTDDWRTAHVTHKFRGPLYRLGTSVFVKEGKPFVNFAVGYGVGELRSYSIREAVLKPNIREVLSQPL